MLEEQDWFIKRTHKGAPWTGPLQYEDTTGELMYVVVVPGRHLECMRACDCWVGGWFVWWV